jgi:hypothetical protein
MPKQQIQTNSPLLQRELAGTNNKQIGANSLSAGNHNFINFENNIVAGDWNSAAGQTMILGNNNLVGNPSRVAVIGRDNILTSVEGMVIGLSNSITTPVKNFNLFGVDGLTMTQSVNNVWIFGNPFGTYSVGTQSFITSISAPTQSGIYANQNIFLGPSVNIFDVNGLPISGGSQNLTQVLTVGNSTGGLNIEMNNDQINDSSGNYIEFDSTTGLFIESPNDIDTLSGGTTTITSVGALLITSTGDDIIIDANDNMLIQTGAVGLLEILTNAEDDFRFNTYAFKEINIGDWDMDTTGNVNINHGLSATEYKTIRNIQVTIRDDNDDDYFDLSQDTGNAGIVNGGIAQWNNTTINLVRRTGGQFDGALFDATTYNRGWIRFQYKPD